MEIPPSSLLIPRPRGGRVLVVERSSLAQRHVANLLAGEGYDVVVASTAIAALALLRQAPVQVVVVGTDLADEGAIRLVRGLKLDPLHAAVPVILMFPASDAARYQLALRHQLLGGLPKPVVARDLLALVANAFTPVPAPGQEIEVTHGSSSWRTRVRQGQDVALHLGLPGDPEVAQALVADDPVELSFSVQGLGRARWSGRVVRTTASTAVVALVSYLDKADIRRHARRDLALPVRYRLPDDFSRLGRTRDVSAGGLLLGQVVDRPVAPGTRLELAIVVGIGERLEGLVGEVRRVLPGPEPAWGVALVAPRREHQEALHRLVFDLAPEGEATA